MIESYLDTIIQELSTNPIISAFKIIRKVIGDRGHESMERKLAGIGADISRVK